MEGIAFISDIHANSLALRAVLDDVRSRGLERVYCLGDLVGYGPDPNGVIDLIQTERIPTIAGNYDDGVGWERGDCGCYYATPEARAIGEVSYAFTVRVVTADHKAFLRELPRERLVDLDALTLHLVHGSPRRINEYLMKERSERTYVRLAETETADALVFGHTHEQWHRQYGGVEFVAVGSVGKPKDGDPQAMYTIVRESAGARIGSGSVVEVEPVRVAYDVEATARAIVVAGLSEELAEAVRQGR